jgi:acyl-CoA thioesterase-1
MRRLLLCLLLSLPLSQASAEDTTVIAAFGDSLFAGLGVAPESAFPAQLERKLKADGYYVKVINDSISGDTTEGGAARIESVLAQKPDIVIVELGSNDMLRALPPQEVGTNLDQILSRFNKAGIKIIVAGQKAPLSFGLHYAADYNPIFCDLAKKYNSACYPVILEGVYEHTELMQADGMHPNADGAKVIVDKMYPLITKLLKK